MKPAEAVTFPPLALWKAALTLTPSEETEARRCEVSPRGTPLCASFCVGDKIVPSQGRPPLRETTALSLRRQLQGGGGGGIFQPPVWQDLEVGLPQVSRRGWAGISHRATEPPLHSSLCPQAKVPACNSHQGLFLLQDLPFSPSSSHLTPTPAILPLPLPPCLHPVPPKEGL